MSFIRSFVSFPDRNKTFVLTTCTSKMKVSLPILAAVLALAASRLPALIAADESAVYLADEAIAARYKVEKLLYEKQMVERTIKGAETIAQQTAKSAPQLRAAVKKAEKDLEAARAELARKTTVAEAAKQKAASGRDQDKTAAVNAEKERLAADQVVRQKENDYRRDVSQLQRTDERLKKSEADMAAAKLAVPQKEAAAAEARKKADALRARAVEADRQKAASQDPLAVARQIDAFIDARLKSEGITASPQIDDAEFLRRATLDVTGVIPKYEEVLAYLNDASAEKRAALVDRLLTDAGYGRNMAQRFCTVTTENGTSTLNPHSPDEFPIFGM